MSTVSCQHRVTLGFKAGQSPSGGLGIEREVSQTLNAHMSALEPTMFSYKRIIGLDGYNANLTGQVTMTITGQRICHKHIPTVVAFAQNTRDEVRKVNGDGKIAGALAARPGAKQQTYLMTVNGEGQRSEVRQRTWRLLLRSARWSLPTVADRRKTDRRKTDESVSKLSHQTTQKTSALQNMRIGSESALSLRKTLHQIQEIRESIHVQEKSVRQTTRGEVNMTAEVRRLTEVECCRLQGIPDDHPFIYGKETSSSSVYSVQGNGWARNCSRLVFKNIHLVDGKYNGCVRPFKIGSVSSGQGTHELSVCDFKDQSVFFSEIAPFPCEILKTRFPGVQNLGDVTRISYDAEKGVLHNRKKDGYELMSEQQLGFKPVDAETVEIPLKYGEMDCISGGLPCTSVSVAGKRNGAAEGSGTRSALAYELPRIGNECGARWLVYENVPGLISSNGGTDLAWFLYRLQQAGYSIAWRTLDAQYVRSDIHPRAVPQRRRRIWLVAYRGEDWRVPCEALFEPMKALGTEPPVRTVGVGYVERGQRSEVKGQTEELSDSSSTNYQLPTTNSSQPADELLEFNEFMKGTKESIIKILVDKGICQSPEERRKELAAAKKTVDMAQDDLFGGDLFGPVEPHHQGRGLKAKDLDLNLPDEPSLAKVGFANLYEWAKSVSSEVCYCGRLFKGEGQRSEVKGQTVDDLDPKMLSNLGNAGFLSNGIVCTMKMPEWNAGITEEELATMPRELAELYDGDVCGLSDILEENPDAKYKLSWRACYGILNRAVKRAKMLPIELSYALVERIINQAPIVKWYAMNGKDTVKKEGQLSERAIAKIAFDDYIEAEWHWVDVKEELPKKGEAESETEEIDEAIDEAGEEEIESDEE